MAADLMMKVRMPVEADTSKATGQFRNLANEASKTEKLVTRISNASVQFSKIVGQAAHSAQQSFLQVSNRVKNLQQGMQAASSSAFSLAQRLNSLGRGMLPGQSLTQLSTLNTRLNNVSDSALAGASSMSRLHNAAQLAGSAGARSMETLSASTMTAVAGIATLTKFLHESTKQMERMDILRASYQRIMGARPDMADASVLNSAVGDFWKHSIEMARSYGVAIDDVAGTMIEFARQGHSPSTVQYLTKELAELRLLLATSTGNLVDMKSAMGSVITLMNQMGASALDAVDGLKLMAEYDIRTASNFSAISDALNRFASAGKVAGMSIQDMIKAATAFTEIGIKGARAGTALNTIIARVSNTKKAREMLDSLGVGLTTIENGAVRAMSTFERLLEGYKIVKATGDRSLLQLFGYNMAGARMQSVLFAGLEQYIKQTSPSVSTAQVYRTLDSFSERMNKTLSALSITPTIKDVSIDAASLKKKMQDNIEPLVKQFREEFEKSGKIALPDDISLVKRLLGLSSNQEAAQIRDAYSETFKSIRAEFDSFFSSIESVYDSVSRIALSNSEEALAKRQAALETMIDTLQNKYTRAKNAFQEPFISVDAISGYNDILDKAVNMFGRLGNLIADVGGTFLSLPGSITVAGTVLEAYFGSHILKMLGNLGPAAYAATSAVTSSIYGVFSSTASSIDYLYGKATQLFTKGFGALFEPAWGVETPHWIQGVINAFGTAEERLAQWQKMVGDMPDPTKPFENTAGLLTKFSEAVSRTQEASDQVTLLTTVLNDANTTLEGLLSPTETLVERTNRAEAATDTASRAWREYSQSLANAATAMDIIAASSERTVVAPQMNPLAQLQDNIRQLAQEQISAFAGMEQQILRMPSSVSQVTEELRRMSAEAQNVANDMGTMLMNIQNVFSQPLSERFIQQLQVAESTLGHIREAMPRYLFGDIAGQGMQALDIQSLNDFVNITERINNLTSFENLNAELERTQGGMRGAALSVDGAIDAVERLVPILNNATDEFRNFSEAYNSIQHDEAGSGIIQVLGAGLEERAQALTRIQNDMTNAANIATHRDLLGFERTAIQGAVDAIHRFTQEGQNLTTSLPQMNALVEQLAEHFHRVGSDNDAQALRGFFDAVTQGSTTFDESLQNILRHLEELARPGSRGAITLDGQDAVQNLMQGIEPFMHLLQSLQQMRDDAVPTNFAPGTADTNAATQAYERLQQALQGTIPLIRQYNEELQTADTPRATQAAQNNIDRWTNEQRAIRALMTELEQHGPEGYGDMLSGRLRDISVQAEQFSNNVAQSFVRLDDSSRDSLRNLHDQFDVLLTDIQNNQSVLEGFRGSEGLGDTIQRNLNNGIHAFDLLGNAAEGAINQIYHAFTDGGGAPTLIMELTQRLDELRTRLESLRNADFATTDYNAIIAQHNYNQSPASAETQTATRAAVADLSSAIKVLNDDIERNQKIMADSVPGLRAYENARRQIQVNQELAQSYREVIEEVERQGHALTTGVAENTIARGEEARNNVLSQRRPTTIEDTSILNSVSDVLKARAEKVDESLHRLYDTQKQLSEVRYDAEGKVIARTQEEVDALNNVNAAIQRNTVSYRELRQAAEEAEAAAFSKTINPDFGVSEHTKRAARLMSTSDALMRQSSDMETIVIGHDEAERATALSNSIKGLITDFTELKTVLSRLDENHPVFAELGQSAEQLKTTLPNVIKTLTGNLNELKGVQEGATMQQGLMNSVLAEGAANVEDYSVQVEKLKKHLGTEGIDLYKGLSNTNLSGMDAVKADIEAVQNGIKRTEDVTKNLSAAFKSMKLNPQLREQFRDLNAGASAVSASGSRILELLRLMRGGTKLTKAEVQELVREFKNFNEATAQVDRLNDSLVKLAGSAATRAFGGLKTAIDTMVGGFFAAYGWITRIVAMVRIVKNVAESIADWWAKIATNSKEITAEFEKQAQLQKIMQRDIDAAKTNKEQSEEIYGGFRDSLTSASGNLDLLRVMAGEAAQVSPNKELFSNGKGETTMAKFFTDYRKYMEEYWDRAMEAAKQGEDYFKKSPFKDWKVALGDLLNVDGDVLKALTDNFEAYMKIAEKFDIDSKLKAVVDMQKTEVSNILKLQEEIKSQDTAINEIYKGKKESDGSNGRGLRENLADALRRLKNESESEYAYHPTGKSRKEVQERVNELKGVLSTRNPDDASNDALKMEIDNLEAFLKAGDERRQKAIDALNSGGLRTLIQASLGDVQLENASIEQINRAILDATDKVVAAGNSGEMERLITGIEGYTTALGNNILSDKTGQKIKEQMASMSNLITENSKNKSNLAALTVPTDKSSEEKSVESMTKHFEARQKEVEKFDETIDDLKARIEEAKQKGDTDEANSLVETLKKTYEEQGKAAEALRAEIERYSKAENIKGMSGYLDAVAQTKDTYAEISQSFKDILNNTQETDENRQALQEAREKISQLDKNILDALIEEKRLNEEATKLEEEAKKTTDKIRQSNLLEQAEDARKKARDNIRAVADNNMKAIDKALTTLMKLTDDAGRRAYEAVRSRLSSWLGSIMDFFGISSTDSPVDKKAQQRRVNIVSLGLSAIDAVGGAFSKIGTAMTKIITNVGKNKNSADNSVKSRTGVGSRKDPNKDALQELLANFAEELDLLKVAYQTVKDEEGNIIRYLDQTGTYEYIEKQIETLRRQRDELAKFLSSKNLKPEIRRKAEKELRKLDLQVVKMELDLDMKHWKEAKTQMEHDKQMLEKQLSIGVEFIGLERQKSLMDEIWRITEAIYKKELEQATDPLKKQELELHRINDIIKHQETLIQQNTDAFKKQLEIFAKTNIGPTSMSYADAFKQNNPTYFSKSNQAAINTAMDSYSDIMFKTIAEIDTQISLLSERTMKKVEEHKKNLSMDEKAQQYAIDAEYKAMDENMKVLFTDLMASAAESLSNIDIPNLLAGDTIDLDAIVSGLNLDGYLEGALGKIAPVTRERVTRFMEGLDKIEQAYVDKYIELIRTILLTRPEYAENDDLLNEKLREWSIFLQEQFRNTIGKKAKEAAEKTYKEYVDSVMNAFKSAWDTGFDIGYEYGFSSEGWSRLAEHIKKLIASNISNYLRDQISMALRRSLTDGLTEATKSATMKMNFGTQFLVPTLSGIIGSVVGFALGAVFNGLFDDITSAIEQQAEEQLKQQRDQINAQGFSWSYGTDSSSTPYYEFSPPVTQESIKVIKFSSTFNITTDAALALASHRRELERVCAEIIEAYNRNAAKTVGAAI